MNRFLHFSNDANLEFNESIIDEKYKTDKNPFKPIGLWLSKNCEWLYFRAKGNCPDDLKNKISKKIMEENYSFEIYNYYYEFELNFSNILVISTIEEIINFCNNWSKTIFTETNQIFGTSNSYVKYRTEEIIDWKKLKNHYDGIYFNNFAECYIKIIKTKSLLSNNLYLYYIALDCSSVCIWNKKCIKSYKKYEIPDE